MSRLCATGYQLPGMRVLQFGFDGNSNNPHLPLNYGHNVVALHRDA
jgi:4-alpha-glucanotransferase